MKKILLAGAFAALATSAVAADLPSRRAPVAYAPVAPVFASWTGGYVGLEVGYDWFSPKNPTVKGAQAGIRAGYDWQIGGNFVVGLLGNVDYSWARGKNASVAVDTKVSSNYRFALDGRAGYLVTPNTLVYALAGYTNAPIKGTTISTGVKFIDKAANGYNVGLGLEQKITANWSAFGEYRFNRLFLSNAGNTSAFNDHEVKLGLNYRFGGPSAIVAKY